ncbi:prepilin-type N-terminal cleavage/methylation domain-containing protein [Patescibacteria group bacterium]|nr:prepilin-type N-terminal cleavage/methylation domain-containing protein [Patescibacteria group bacterium]
MFLKNKKQAFTLIELIVVIGITVIISAMVISNMRAGGDVINLNSNAEKLGEIIKTAQMMSLSGKQVSDIRPSGGYGVFVDSDTYILFADTDSVDDHEYNAGSDDIIQVFNFGANISLPPLGQETYIIFMPPKGDVYVPSGVNGGIILTGNHLITLKHLINRYAYVEVNSQGQIDVRKVE